MTPSFDIMAQAAVETLRISLPTIVEAKKGTVTARICDDRLDVWSRRLLVQAGIGLEVTGREHLVAGEGYVVMSNHRSHYDIPVLYQSLRIPMRMVVKRELFRIPFMAAAMRAAGFIELDRQNQRRAIKALLSVENRLPSSMSMWIAPEGTRSRNGDLGPFKRGGFCMALAYGRRVLPVTIDGTQRTLPAGCLTVVQGHTVRVTINPPINPEDYGHQRIADLMEDARRVIERALGRDSAD